MMNYLENDSHQTNSFELFSQNLWAVFDKVLDILKIMLKLNYNLSNMLLEFGMNETFAIFFFLFG